MLGLKEKGLEDGARGGGLSLMHSLALVANGVNGRGTYKVRGIKVGSFLFGGGKEGVFFARSGLSLPSR